MNLPEALEIQTIHNDHNPNFTDAERQEAHQLGIEAINFIILSRAAEPGSVPELLPGETY